MSITTVPAQLTRPYLSLVRPLHRETLDSFSTRLLAANFEDSRHKQHLLTIAKSTTDTEWAAIVTRKGRLTPGHFDRAAHTGLTHPDGTTCTYCADGIAQQWMCTLCSQGATVTQYPHLDSYVCIEHHRWIAPGTPPAKQHRVTSAHVAAELTFRKLRRRGVLDPVLLNRLSRAFTGAQPDDEESVYEDFPAMMAVIAAVTSYDFVRSFTDPTQSYATSWSILQSRVMAIVSRDHLRIARAIWLHFRSTMLSLREHLTTGQPYERAWAHDLLIPATIISAYAGAAPPSEPFEKYLEASDDLTVSPATYRDVLIHHDDPPTVLSSGKASVDDTVQSICFAGHRSTLRRDEADLYHGPRGYGCRICSHRQLLPGFNDLMTRYPTIGAELHPEDNYGTTANSVLVGSFEKYHWRCSTAGHRFIATPNQRINSEHAECPVCKAGTITDRTAEPATINLTERRPRLAAEWHPTRNAATASHAPIGTNEGADWICLRGHTWTERIEIRLSGSTCRVCAMTPHDRDTLFASLHPSLAAEWDTIANGPLAIETISVGSDRVCYWRCTANGHPFARTPRTRAETPGCPSCPKPRRNAKSEPDTTPPAVRFPKIIADWDTTRNGNADPRTTIPLNKANSWICRFGHRTQQSIEHRVRSNGCIKCDPRNRSGN